MHGMTGGVDCRVSVPDELLAVAEDGRSWDLAPFERRDGFSPVGTVVIQLGVAVDGDSLPSVDDPDASLADGAAVQVWDLDTGERLRHFAEVDAHPIPRDEARVLLVRPLEHWGFGRRIGVVLTNSLRDLSGSSIDAPDGFAGLRSGGGDRDDPVVQHYAALLAELEELGCFLRDAETGVVECYGELEGEIVYFTWMPGQGAFQCWHPLDQSYVNRQPLPGVAVPTAHEAAE